MFSINSRVVIKYWCLFLGVYFLAETEDSKFLCNSAGDIASTGRITSRFRR
jgi:hypothetical protein